MSRYNLKQDVGIYAIGGISTQLGWIFRLLDRDVGVDAMFEFMDDSNPTGEFLAAQIKTGLGNVTEVQSGFVYYCTQVHHDYWLGMSLPTILLLHDPDQGITYFQFISESHFERTPQRWKLHIPLINRFDESSKDQIELFVRSFSRRWVESHSEDRQNPEAIIERASQLRVANDAIKRATSAMAEWTATTESKTTTLKKLLENGHDINSPVVKAHLRTQGKTHKALAERLRAEIGVFATSITDGILGQQELHGVVESGYTKTRVEALRAFLSSFDVAIDSTEKYQRSIDNGPTDVLYVSQAARELAAILSSFCHELIAGRELCQDLLVFLESRTGLSRREL